MHSVDPISGSKTGVHAEDPISGSKTGVHAEDPISGSKTGVHAEDPISGSGMGMHATGGSHTTLVMQDSRSLSTSFQRGSLGGADLKNFASSKQRLIPRSTSSELKVK